MTKKTNILAKIILLCFSAQSALAYRRSESCRAIEKEPFSYEGRSNGPRKWGRTFPLCNGEKQSPINIDTDDVNWDKRLEKLTLVNYDVPLKRAEILNNGHTVEITPKDNVHRFIKIEGSVFKLRQLHFHWSKKHYEGTEHALDHYRYDMEAHFVHTNEHDETAVVAVLYKAVSGKNWAFQPIVDILPHVRYQRDRAVLVDDVKLDGLLPSNPASFYRYKGSLTTPPCTEGVTWSVLKEVFHVGKEQLSQFFELYAVPKYEARPGCKITTNVRPIQHLNDREVVCSH